MGIYDREYYRDDEPKGFFVGGSWTAVGTIVFLNVVVYLVSWSLPALQANEYLALRADLFQRIYDGGQWDLSESWRITGLLTHGFAHSENPFHILFNMLVLWVLGREVEGVYGKRIFWRLYLSLVVMAGVCWLLVENFLLRADGTLGPVGAVVGASGAVTGVLVIFVLHFPTRTLLLMGVLPVPAWLLGVVWLVSDLFGQARDMAGGNEFVAYSAHLAGAVFGAIFYRWHWTLFSLLPTYWISRLRLARRRKLRVVREVEEEKDLDEQVDRILAKISRYGTESLTEEEQRTLEAASRRAQRRRGVRSD